ncbi:MAG: hypothetical protein DRH70_05580 [Candidatus Coatesbacteria bacterium]|nr:MAG: hypothetical protein DRH70_05580 [Candidatus Coatesbacteria bacterium]
MGGKLSVVRFSSRFAPVIASIAALHITGLYYGRLNGYLMFCLTVLFVASTSLAFLLGLSRRAQPFVGANRPVRPAKDLFWRAATCVLVALAIGTLPGWPAFLGHRALALGLLGLIVAACWVTFGRPISFASILALAFLLCQAWIWLPTALDPRHTDMLPLIKLACRRFLAGANPYTNYLMPWNLPLTYLPATWLAFLPAEVYHIDPRFLTTLLTCSAVLTIYMTFRPSHLDPAAGPAKLLLALVLLSSITLRFSAITPGAVFWFALSLFIFFLAGKMHIAAALTMGVCLAARQQAVLLLPFYAIFLFRSVGSKTALRCLVLAIAVPVSLCLPFVIDSPHQFLDGIYGRFAPFAVEKWLNERVWERSLSFAPFFFQHRVEFLLKPIIAGTQLLLLALAIGRLRRLADLVDFMGLSLLSFLLFSPVIWPYMFTPLLVLLLGSSLLRSRDGALAGSSETGPLGARARHQ